MGTSFNRPWGKAMGSRKTLKPIWSRLLAFFGIFSWWLGFNRPKQQFKGRFWRIGDIHLLYCPPMVVFKWRPQKYWDNDDHTVNQRLDFTLATHRTFEQKQGSSQNQNIAWSTVLGDFNFSNEKGKLMNPGGHFWLYLAHLLPIL